MVSDALPQALAGWREAPRVRALSDRHSDGQGRYVLCVLRRALRASDNPAIGAATRQDLPAPVALDVHRWRYAKSGRLGRDDLWDDPRRLALCGDWLLGGRVEAAWLSGRRLARIIGAAQAGVAGRGC